MSLGKLFASITERRRRSAQQPYEEGAQIKRRLQELLTVPSPTQRSKYPSATPVLKTTQPLKEPA
jgi:hypothetical protein